MTYILSCASEQHLKFKTLQKESVSDLNYFSFNIMSFSDIFVQLAGERFKRVITIEKVFDVSHFRMKLRTREDNIFNIYQVVMPCKVCNRFFFFIFSRYFLY